MAEKQHTTMKWRERMTFDGTTTDGHTLTVDAAAGHGGDGRGPKPIELLLTALAGCTGMDVISVLQKKREPVESFEVFVEGQRATEHPMIYTDIEIVYRVTGNVNPASIERAIELSRTKYCGVQAMLGKAANITDRYEILPSAKA
jgi:putative redox protein